MKRFANDSKTLSAKVSSSQVNAPLDSIGTSSTISHLHKSVFMQSLNTMQVYANPSGPREEMYVLYAVNNLSPGALESPLASAFCNVLSCKQSGLNPHQSTMNQCLLALATVFYGVKKRESRILRDGADLYGRGINMLSDILAKPKYIISTDVIIAVLCMSISEVCILCFFAIVFAAV